MSHANLLIISTCDIVILFLKKKYRERDSRSASLQGEGLHYKNSPPFKGRG
jgi:hypothetical protein